MRLASASPLDTCSTATLLVVDVVAGILRRNLGIGPSLTPGDDIARVAHHSFPLAEARFHRVQAFRDPPAQFLRINPAAQDLLKLRAHAGTIEDSVGALGHARSVASLQSRRFCVLKEAMPVKKAACRGVSFALETDFSGGLFFDFLGRCSAGLRAPALAAICLATIGLRPAPGLFPPRGMV